MNIPQLAIGMANQTPSFQEWINDEFTIMVMRDIFDTLVLGAEKRPFYDYIGEPSQSRFEKQKCAAFRHLLHCHESGVSGDGHAVDHDSGKHHLANALARAFIARGQQIELKRGSSMKDMDEAINE